MIRDMERLPSPRAREAVSAGPPVAPEPVRRSVSAEAAPAWEETRDDGYLRVLRTRYREGCVAELRKVPEEALPALRSLEPGLSGLDCWLYLDIETTGLVGAGTLAFLVGLGEWNGEFFEIAQFLLKDRAGEERLLREVSAELTDRPAVVTFNGRAFDLPVLQSRVVFAGMIPPRLPSVHLDLLSLVKNMGRRPEYGQSLREAVRRFTGAAREGDIPGSLVPALYFVYERDGDLSVLEPVMRHNRLDVLDMACLSWVFGHVLAGRRDAGDAAAFGGAGKLHYRKGNLDLARRCLEAALDGGSPKNLRSLRLLGHVLRRQSQWEAAEKVWEEVASSGEASDEDYLWLARCREFTGGANESLEVVERAISLRRSLGQEPLPSLISRKRRLERLMGRKGVS